MSKAKERALEAYPIIMHTLIPVHEDTPEIEQDCNEFHRQAYIKGYHQAEKDLELTWRDIKAIDQLLWDLCAEYSEKNDNEGYFKEVLKRFKDLKMK